MLIALLLLLLHVLDLFLSSYFCNLASVLNFFFHISEFREFGSTFPPHTLVWIDEKKSAISEAQSTTFWLPAKKLNNRRLYFSPRQLPSFTCAPTAFAQFASLHSTRKQIWILLCAEAAVINTVHDVHNRFGDPAVASAFYLFLFFRYWINHYVVQHTEILNAFHSSSRNSRLRVSCSQYICGFRWENSLCKHIVF